MNAPLTVGKFPLDGRSIVLAGALAILMSIAPHEASARGGPLHLLDAWAASRAEAATKLLHAKSQRPKLWAWAVVQGDTETQLPIDVAAPPILGIEARRIAVNIAKLPEYAGSKVQDSRKQPRSRFPRDTRCEYPLRLCRCFS
jgi:hypothetical protein